MELVNSINLIKILAYIAFLHFFPCGEKNIKQIYKSRRLVDKVKEIQILWITKRKIESRIKDLNARNR